MKFLLTNDDGWDAPGLAALARAAKPFGEVWIVAPAGPMSGISHQVTWLRPLELIEKSDRWFSLDGTPADCVRIAVSQLGIDFDWVISGINNGGNLGTDIFVSGTVAATREAIMQGYRSFAFSQHRLDITDENYDWAASERFAHRMITMLIDENSRFDSTIGVNVNFPEVAKPQVDQTPIVDCELDCLPVQLEFLKEGQGTFVPNAVYNQRQRTPGQDIDVCFKGNVSVTGINMQGFTQKKASSA